jgi:hypothetical protein
MMIAAPIDVHVDTGTNNLALILAVLGLCIALANVVWSVVSWRLTAGRVKATLSWAARKGTLIFTMAPSGMYPGDYFAGQGATTAAVAMNVRNVGRSPVFVDNYAVHCENGMEAGWLRGTGALAGIPELPLKLEAGAVQMFYVDLDQIYSLIAAAFAMQKLAKPEQRAWMVVTLGDGRSIRTKQEVLLRPPEDLVDRALETRRRIDGDT